MPANSDHVRRDAEHAARSDIRVQLSKFLRRLDEAAKAHIAERLANAEPGELIDGTQVGREAAQSALLNYLVDEGADSLEAPAAVGSGTEAA